MKRKTAKEILAESFRELAKSKNIDKITIKDITDNCGYSPATFYRQFRDKYDLIAWEYTRGVAAIMDLDHPVETVLVEVDFSAQEATGKYVCSVCGYVYDPEEHDGVAFEDLPEDWRCPRCRQPKEKFNRA